MAYDETTQRISADQPLLNPTDDELGRDRFSAGIARSLANWKGEESLIISLTGEWGSGKSTLKNFIKHHLDGNAITVEFNPWQWSGQDKILEGFLWQIGAMFGRNDIAKHTRSLAKKWEAFATVTRFGGEMRTIGEKLTVPLLSLSAVASLLAYAATFSHGLKLAGVIIIATLALLSVVSTASEKISKMLKGLAELREKTLEELRSEIDKELRKLKEPVVVFVDDIDRLTKEEIKLVIQLVKANAQFPNLIYVLLFQKDIVIKALGEITSDDGAKYLRKIVQVEFDVPVASNRQMRQMLTSGLERIINRDEVKCRWPQRHWETIFLDDLWPYFRNLRDIKRFLSSFAFYFSQHINNDVLEVNPVDLIAIEILRMFDHATFVAISNSFLVDQGSTLNHFHRKDKIAAAFVQSIDDIVGSSKPANDEGKRLKHLLQSLFPQSSGDDSRNEWRRDFRICDEFSFYKYFEINIDGQKSSAHEVTKFIAESGDRALLVEILNQAIQRGTIESLLESVFVTKEEIPLENMVQVSTALFDVGDIFPDVKFSILNFDLGMQSSRIIYHRLKSEDSKKTTEILWEAYTATTGLILPIETLALEDKNVRARNGKESYVIDEAKVIDFINLELGRIRAKAEDDTLLECRHLESVLYRWRDWAGKSEVNAWLLKVISNASRALEVLRHLTSKRIINGVREELLLAGDSIETLIDLETLNTAVKEKSEAELTPSDIIRVKLLAKAVKFKSAGRKYTEISLDDSWRS